MKDFVVYLRCSTGKQQASGLGIEAQREAVQRYTALTGGNIIAEYTETESGAKSDRPQLAKALGHCRRTKSTLLIARLDRLSRSLSFVAQLLDANVEIRCADMPEANRLLLQMLAVFGEHERQMIRERTKAALVAAKVRGTILGANGATLAAENRAKAQAHAESLRVAILEARSTGHVSLTQIAKFLARHGHKTAENGKWHAMSVKRILGRL